jgi:molybdate transport system substrate-binding protein
LLTQIKNGAPIDVFISAAPAQMDALAKDKRLIDATRRVVGGKKLVVVVPAKSTLAAKSLDELAKADVARIAIGEPRIVPAGQYAVEALQRLKLYDGLKAKVYNGQNARQVLDYVVRGEVDAGFVYQTDAEQAGLKVRKLFDVPADTHEPIVYPGAVLAASKKQGLATEFLDYTRTSRGRWILQNRHGFVVDFPATRPTTRN